MCQPMIQTDIGLEMVVNCGTFDSIKNGLLISKGYCVVRIRYLCRHMSQSVQRRLWALVSEQVEKIEDKFPSKNNRFIELEID